MLNLDDHIGDQILTSLQFKKADCFFIKTNYIPRNFSLVDLERFIISKNQMYLFVFIQKLNGESIIGIGFDNPNSVVDIAQDILFFFIEKEMIIEFFESKTNAKNLFTVLKSLSDKKNNKNIKIELTNKDSKFMECFNKEWYERRNRNDSSEKQKISAYSVPVSDLEKTVSFTERIKFVFDMSPKRKYILLKQNQNLICPFVDELSAKELTMHSSLI